MSAPQSQETMAAEEADGVRQILEGQSTRPRGSSTPAASPTAEQGPFRSMLDVGEPETKSEARHASIAGTTPRGITFSTPPVPQRNGPEFPTSPRVRATHSAQASPVDANHPKSATATVLRKHRSQSDAAARPANFGPRSVQQPSLYKFSNFLSNNPGAVLPKRNGQAGKRQSLTGAMASALTGDLSGLMARSNRSRHDSVTSNTSKSRSPQNRFSLRSSSPCVSKEKLELDTGRSIDKDDAHRRLSDVNLANAGGSLAELGEKAQRRRSTNSNDGPVLAKLEKDYTTPNQEEVLDESSDEEQSSADEGPRGRRKSRKKRSGSVEEKPDGEKHENGEGEVKQFLGSPVTGEADRQELTAQEQHKVRSLLDPEITVTSPGGDRPKSSKVAIHPNTSFESNSGLNTPVDSDAEENIVDIKRAQKLAINMTEIMSTAATKRCVRVLHRGDFPKMQQEAADEIRRVRKYMVAMDLSAESQHALEWTIGTVLRDGDTLLAIYCAEEPKEESGSIADEAQTKAQIAAIAAQTSRASGSTPILAANGGPGPVNQNLPKLDSPTTSASPVGRKHGKLEHERVKYVQIMTDRLSLLLRKTKLQVRIVIEVIHCKSPKHLIVEVIDHVDPTMVVLGSRGRSSLQGVMLGSFSNYLVTKSSVPVMVARKKLKKHHKIKRPRVRLANNLSNPANRTLEDARID